MRQPSSMVASQLAWLSMIAFWLWKGVGICLSHLSFNGVGVTLGSTDFGLGRRCRTRYRLGRTRYSSDPLICGLRPLSMAFAWVTFCTNVTRMQRPQPAELFEVNPASASRICS